MTKGLVLIASYPKSGNTWTRLVFDKLNKSPDEVFSINALSRDVVLKRKYFDDLSPVDTARLTYDEMEAGFPDVLRRLASGEQGLVTVKVHDFARQTILGEWMYPPDAVHSVIYLVRHPFDVAVSFANHMGVTIEKSIDGMGTHVTTRPAPGNLPIAILPLVGSWSRNIESWITGPYNVTLARYEDIHSDPISEFQRLAGAAGIAASRRDVEVAVEATRFDSLQKEEAIHGFRERPKASKVFFRVGRPGTWQDILDESMQQRLVQDHESMMERLGYRPDGTTVALPARPC